ncbi:MAG: nitroreductase family deazaflavin-dependent oxidoreductase [Chloroflexi bacterium]|nr:nitroreductase family deazaflavin-dependent oxidoreductase [Chloroflexota bacterium]
MSDWNQKVIEEFRANNGRVAAFARQPLLLLTHTGAKSGKQRTNPLAYFRDGDRYVVVASKGGAPANPDWYYNLIANPRAVIEVGNEKLEVVAEQAEPVERERIFAMINDLNPTFKEYEKKAGRIIPLMILSPALSDVEKSGNK